MAVRLPDPDELDVTVGPMRRRHLRSVLRIEQQVSRPEVISPADLASDLLALGEDVLLAGDGALRYQSMFEEVRRLELADHSEAYPLEGSLVQLAHARALREEFVGPEELTPMYLRKPDAEINWTTRDGVHR